MTIKTPIGYVAQKELARIRSGYDANLRSARFGPSHLDGDVAVYLEADGMPKRVPLSDEQIDDMWGDSNRGFSIEKDHYWKAVRDTEAAHGINQRLEN